MVFSPWSTTPALSRLLVGSNHDQRVASRLNQSDTPKRPFRNLSFADLRQSCDFLISKSRKCMRLTRFPCTSPLGDDLDGFTRSRDFKIRNPLFEDCGLIALQRQRSPIARFYALSLLKRAQCSTVTDGSWRVQPASHVALARAA